MIPSIRHHIDEANYAIGDGDGHRIPIPSSELAVLSDLRRIEYTRQAREVHNARLLEMVEDEARTNEEDGVNMERPFGLPLGEASQDIWELIFEHVNDVEDVVNLRKTCVMFKEMLARKYKTLRFSQVASKFASKFGGLICLLNLRLVCKSSNAFVHRRLSEDELRDDMNQDEYRVSTVAYFVHPEQASLNELHQLLPDLESPLTPPDSLPIRSFSIIELSRDEQNQIFQDPTFHPNNPLVPELRTGFQKFLEVAGSCIRSFEYFSVLDSLGAYNQLRSWITLMPNLESIAVSVVGDFRNPENLPVPSPPVQDLTPFPLCPRLKRFINKAWGINASCSKHIFMANPAISELILYYWPGAEMNKEALADFATVQLKTVKLYGVNAILPPEILEFRPQWPLKSLSLLVIGENEETSLRALFKFVNSFKATLEELEVNWRLRDTGEYLDLPKVSRLSWKFWPNFMTFDFMVALENLRHLDVDVVACEEVNTSLENVKGFIKGNNLPSIFPGLKRIRAMMVAAPEGTWIEVW